MTAPPKNFLRILFGSLIIVTFIVSSVIFAYRSSFIGSSSQYKLQTSIVSQLTGKHALNDSTIVNIRGTDLGIPFMHKDRYYFAFGDTVSNSGVWQPTAMAYSSDTDIRDGIILSGWIRNNTQTVRQILYNYQLDKDEHTAIPTTAFSDGNKIYIFYMSIREWSPMSGIWYSNYAELAYSIDDGQTFIRQRSVHWGGNSNFVQFGLCQGFPNSSDNNYYFLATPSGRFGACYLTKVDKGLISDLKAYKYYTGHTANNTALWGTEANATAVIPGPVGELSVMWNAYLQQWVVMYYDEASDAIMLRMAKQLWGPWSTEYIVAISLEFQGLYGNFMHPNFIEDNGRVIYFIMSIWQVYNTFVMKVDVTDLKK